MIGGYATIDLEWRVYIPTLSNGSERFSVRIGLTDDGSAGAGNPITDGVYFDYFDTVSPNWRCSTASNSSRTETVSSVAVAAGSFVKLRTVFSPSDAKFYINGTLAVTTITNLPTGAARAFGISAAIQKTIGTTARQLNIDYCLLKVDWTTDR